jgi:tol-pal system protein YbgF
MKKYPQSPSAGSAQFWAAESFFSMGDNARAISEFQNLTEKFPQHPRVKEAVLKQGIAFQKMKKYQEATLFYQKVIGAYPRSAEALQAQGRLSRLQALEGGKSLALQMSATPGPTPSPKPSTGTPRYDQPVMKPIPHPGANPPPTAPKPANTPPVPAVPQTQEKSEAPLF